MRRDKYLTVFLSGLLLLSLTLSGCVKVVENQERKIIAVAAKKDSGSFWNAVLSGAEDAASENGYGLTFRGPETDGQDGLEEQKEIIRLAMENHAVGLLVAAVGPGLADLMEDAFERNIKVIQLDSGLFDSDSYYLKKHKISPVIASVYTNNEKAAAINAEHLFSAVRQDIAGSLVPYVVGVLQHDLSPSGRDRAKGFVDAFEALAEEDPETRGKYRIEVVKCSTDRDNNYGKALEKLRKKGVRAVFLTNQEAVNQVYDQIRNCPLRYDYILFTGFDSGKKQVEWMRSTEGPKLLGSVTQDAYALGYNAALQCVNGMEARGVTAFVEIPAAWYDKENLEEMQIKNLVFG